MRSSLLLQATDADGKGQGGGKVTFAIRDGNTPDGAFEIHPSSGEISITRPLSHLDTPSSIYTLTIRATDAGTHQFQIITRFIRQLLKNFIPD